MKKKLLLTLLCIVNFITQPIASQTVRYKYDLSGNINYREIIELKSTRAKSDTIIAPAVIEDNQLEVKIYPNPTKGILKVEIKGYQENEVLRFRLYDISARLLMDKSTTNAINNFDLSSFSNGIYILQMERHKKASSWRIIKN